jgi:hypothetical protein
MARLRVEMTPDGLVCTTSGWPGWSGGRLAFIFLLLAGIFLTLSLPVIIPALGQIFGPRESGIIAWIGWFITQVAAGNMVIGAIIGVGCTIAALAFVFSWCFQSRCVISGDQLRSEFYLAGICIAVRVVPLSAVAQVHAFLISSAGGYKICADLCESARDPVVEGWWPLTLLFVSRRLADDPREARRILLLTSLSDEKIADQVVLGMERLRRNVTF